MSAQEGEVLQREAPLFDLVFGSLPLHRLPKLLDETLPRSFQDAAIMDLEFQAIEKFDALPIPSES